MRRNSSINSSIFGIPLKIKIDSFNESVYSGQSLMGTLLSSGSLYKIIGKTKLSSTSNLFLSPTFGISKFNHCFQLSCNFSFSVFIQPTKKKWLKQSRLILCKRSLQVWVLWLSKRLDLYGVLNIECD